MIISPLLGNNRIMQKQPRPSKDFLCSLELTTPHPQPQPPGFLVSFSPAILLCTISQILEFLICKVWKTNEKCDHTHLVGKWLRINYPSSSINSFWNVYWLSPMWLQSAEVTTFNLMSETLHLSQDSPISHCPQVVWILGRVGPCHWL